MQVIKSGWPVENGTKNANRDTDFERLSLAPGFSRVNPVATNRTRFNGFPLITKALKRLTTAFGI
jgi:3-oxoacyl-ACP reductase-like protein